MQCLNQTKQISMINEENYLNQYRPHSTLESQLRPLEDGNPKDLSILLEQTTVPQDNVSTISIPMAGFTIPKKKLRKMKKLENLKQKKTKLGSAIVEFQLQNKRTTYTGKKSSSKKNSQNTKSYPMLAQDSTLKDLGYSNYLPEQLMETSKKLWLPIKTECVGSDSSYSNGCLNTVDPKSWFSMSQIKPLPNKNCVRTSCPSLMFSHPESTVDGSIKRKKTKKKPEIQQIQHCEYLRPHWKSKHIGYLCGEQALPDSNRCLEHEDLEQPTYKTVEERCDTILPKGDRAGLICNRKIMKDGKCKCHMENPLYGTLKLRLKPTKHQRKLLNRMYGDKRKTTNLCVDNNRDYTGNYASLLSRFVTQCHGKQKTTNKELLDYK